MEVAVGTLVHLLSNRMSICFLVSVSLVEGILDFVINKLSLLKPTYFFSMFYFPENLLGKGMRLCIPIGYGLGDHLLKLSENRFPWAVNQPHGTFYFKGALELFLT